MPGKKKKKPFNPFDESTYPMEDVFAGGTKLRPFADDDEDDPDSQKPPPPPPVWPEVLDVILAERLPATEANYTNCRTS